MNATWIWKKILILIVSTSLSLCAGGNMESRSSNSPLLMQPVLTTKFVPTTEPPSSNAQTDFTAQPPLDESATPVIKTIETTVGWIATPKAETPGKKPASLPIDFNSMPETPQIAKEVSCNSVKLPNSIKTKGLVLYDRSNKDLIVYLAKRNICIKLENTFPEITFVSPDRSKVAFQVADQVYIYNAQDNRIYLAIKNTDEK